MVEKFHPEINKVYFINKYTLIHILSGNGSIQVDFNNYFDWQDKAVYLEKGQYIKFISDDFVVRKIEFPDEIIFKNTDVRVLFKHLISLGYINFNECSDCQKFLSNTIFSNSTNEIIDISSKQWYWQNPFQAKKEEYQLIFDAKDIIDQEYANHLSNEDLSVLLAENGHTTQALLKTKVGLSIKGLLARKRFIESQKQISFTDKNIQEISYDLGYKDPAYFNRTFKNQTGKSPLEFRKSFDYANNDLFSQNIIALLKEHHMEQRSLDFYAEKMKTSVKSLSTQVREKMKASLGQLIRQELIYSAQKMIVEDETVKEISLKLGFEEPNHFSRFFKHYTGITPSEYRKKKYNF